MIISDKEYFIQFFGSGTIVCSACSARHGKTIKVKRSTYAETLNKEHLMINECHGVMEIRVIRDQKHFLSIGSAFRVKR